MKFITLNVYITNALECLKMVVDCISHINICYHFTQFDHTVDVNISFFKFICLGFLAGGIIQYLLRPFFGDDIKCDFDSEW